ncbi:hypothetical protein KIN20_020497 [Parelaphostrongylus tenuis]|uniref:Uncharacterized protein n=1 Tax=Parelaphostrongylus tenuis TaxID=148309 RepID=A0AAD5N398_PARTN|nr:hypothetical protein KIN20_020497 [Parelaphostrongylus tenuis]
MNPHFVLALLFAFYSTTLSFECSSDIILRMATNKRSEQLERECNLEKTKEEPCDTKSDLENAWKEFLNAENKYKEAVTKCREQASKPTKSLYKHRTRRHTIYGKQEDMNEKVRPESEQIDKAHLIRTRRQVCTTKSSKEMDQLKEDFLAHCERDNICLPDEDISTEQERNRFKELQASRAKKYSEYFTQLAISY